MRLSVGYLNRTIEIQRFATPDSSQISRNEKLFRLILFDTYIVYLTYNLSVATKWDKVAVKRLIYCFSSSNQPLFVYYHNVTYYQKKNLFIIWFNV